MLNGLILSSDKMNKSKLNYEYVTSTRSHSSKRQHYFSSVRDSTLL